MNCKNCGTELHEDARFCPSCGCVVLNILRTVDNQPGTPIYHVTASVESKHAKRFGKKKALIIGVIAGILSLLFVILALIGTDVLDYENNNDTVLPAFESTEEDEKTEKTSLESAVDFFGMTTDELTAKFGKKYTEEKQDDNLILYVFDKQPDFNFGLERIHTTGDVFQVGYIRLNSGKVNAWLDASMTIEKIKRAVLEMNVIVDAQEDSGYDADNQVDYYRYVIEFSEYYVVYEWEDMLNPGDLPANLVVAFLKPAQKEYYAVDFLGKTNGRVLDETLSDYTIEGTMEGIIRYTLDEIPNFSLAFEPDTFEYIEMDIDKPITYVWVLNNGRVNEDFTADMSMDMVQKTADKLTDATLKIDSGYNDMEGYYQSTYTVMYDSYWIIYTINGGTEMDIAIADYVYVFSPNKKITTENAYCPDFAGDWFESSGIRCSINIEFADGIYQISVLGSNGADSHSVWNMTGYYNETTGMLEYSDCVYCNYEYDEKTVNYTDGTGRFMIVNDFLFWEDDVDHSADTEKYSKSY